MRFVGGEVWFEILHYIGIALWLGAVAMLDLRLIGLSKQVPVKAFHLSAAAYAGLALTLMTGLVFFAGSAGAYLGNPLFIIKMIFLVAAVLLSLFVHQRYVAQAVSWPEGYTPMNARLAAGASLLLWIGVLFSGRLITYFGYTQG